MALLGHLFTGAVDNVGGIGVAGHFHIGVLTLRIWVVICHELILSEALRRAQIVVRRPGRIDVLIAVGRVVGVGGVRKAVGALKLIFAGAFNAGGLAFVNGVIRFCFVRRFDGASRHAILRMPISKARAYFGNITGNRRLRAVSESLSD